VTSVASAEARYSPDRDVCRRAIDHRFGWLFTELTRTNGSLSALPPHLQALWYARARVVRRFNRIGEERDPKKRARAYARLTREVTR